MIEWCTNFIANGFWRAFLFTVIFTVVFQLMGGILSLIFKKANLINNIFRYGSSAAAFFIVWNIRHGVGWLIFGILGILGFVVSTIALFVKKPKVTDENIASVAEETNGGKL